MQPLARMWHWTTQHWGQSSALIPASQQDQAFQDLLAHSVMAHGYICNRVINIIEEASVTLNKTEHLSLKINKWMHQLCRLAEGRGRGWGGRAPWVENQGALRLWATKTWTSWSNAAWRRRKTPDRIRWHIIKRNNLLVLQCIHLVAGYTMQEEVALYKQTESAPPTASRGGSLQADIAVLSSSARWQLGLQGINQVIEVNRDCGWLHLCVHTFYPPPHPTPPNILNKVVPAGGPPPPVMQLRALLRVG